MQRNPFYLLVDYILHLLLCHGINQANRGLSSLTSVSLAELKSLSSEIASDVCLVVGWSLERLDPLQKRKRLDGGTPVG